MTEAAGPGLREVLEVMKARYKTPSYELQTGRGVPTQEERDVLSLIFEVERLRAALAEAKDDAPGHCENCRAAVPLTTVHLCATCLPAAPSEHRAALAEAGRSSLPVSLLDSVLSDMRDAAKAHEHWAMSWDASNAEAGASTSFASQIRVWVSKLAPSAPASLPLRAGKPQ